MDDSKWMSSILVEQRLLETIQDTPVGLPPSLDIYQAIDGNGFFCIPQPDTTQMDAVIAATSELVLNMTFPTSAVKDTENYSKGPTLRNDDFLGKQDFSTISNKQRYRMLRFLQYRKKRSNSRKPPRVRYIGRQRSTQKRLRHHGRFVSKHFQSAVTNPQVVVDSPMELDEPFHSESVESSLWVSMPFQDEEPRESFDWYIEYH